MAGVMDGMVFLNVVFSGCLVTTICILAHRISKLTQRLEKLDDRASHSRKTFTDGSHPVASGCPELDTLLRQRQVDRRLNFKHTSSALNVGRSVTWVDEPEL